MRLYHRPPVGNPEWRSRLTLADSWRPLARSRPWSTTKDVGSYNQPGIPASPVPVWSCRRWVLGRVPTGSRARARL